MSDEPQKKDDPSATREAAADASDAGLPHKPAHPITLDYHQPQSNQVVGKVVLFLVGLALSVVAVGYVSAVIWVGIFPIAGGGPPPAHPRLWGWSVGFIALAFVSLFLAKRLWKSQSLGRWFLLGLLMGAGVTSLLEGTCFFMSGSLSNSHDSAIDG